VPSFRLDHSAVWTGEEMIVWGGHCLDTCYRNDGAAFNPLTKQWRPIKTPSFLAARGFHNAFWTGTAMLVWGGRKGGRPFNDGGLYDPKSDEWKPVTMQDVPSLRVNYDAVWTGREMIVWGGQETLVMPDGKLSGGLRFRPDGKIYDPVLDRWRPMSTKGLDTNARKQPAGQESHTTVWTGEEMITWGGARGAGATHLGYRYNLEADMWLPVTNTGSPTHRTEHTAVWTGREMIIWAGVGRGGLYMYAGATGGAYRPTCGAYIFEPQDGDRVNREVTFRLHLSPASASRQAQLVVDGKPHGEWQPVQPDSRVKFPLGDEFTGAHKLRVKTGGEGGAECLSSEVSVEVGPTVKTLRLIYDPVFRGINNLTLRATFGKRYGWHDPVALSDEFNAILLEASGKFAKYEVLTPPLDYSGHLREVNGYTPTDYQLFNMMANCGDRGDTHYVHGWQNLEGVPEGALRDPAAMPGCPGVTEVPEGSDTVSNSRVPLGGRADEMVYAQSFKPWGIKLQKLQLGLSKTGSPTKRVKVSVREKLDGPDLWFSYIRPGEVKTESYRTPTRVHVGADKHNDGRDDNGDGKDEDDDPRDHDEPDDDGDGTSKDIFGRDAGIDLPMKSDALYYLVVTITSEELAGQSTSERPDVNNHYWISTTRDEVDVAGRSRFIDAESQFYGGSTPWPDRDMSVKLAYSHVLDIKHLATEVNFDVKGKSQSIAAHVRDGTIDEVHLFRSPLHDTPEAVMLGPGAYHTNAEPITEGVDSGRAFVLMGFNYERLVPEMLESYGHRAEGIMSTIYGKWNNYPYFIPLPTQLPMLTNWDRFTSFSGIVGPKEFPSCGTAHHPPNVLSTEYDYTQPRKVKSLCQDWLNYPRRKKVATVVSPATWGRGCANLKDVYCHNLGYFKWWYAHFPKVSGRNLDGSEPDGKLNNWWRYIVEPDYYKQ
jgi:hypothetical protein